MTEHEKGINERLRRLARATEPLGTTPGFESRVMQVIQAEDRARVAPGWLAGVVWASRHLLAAAALAATLGFVLAAREKRSADKARAAAYTGMDEMSSTALEMEAPW